VRIKQTVFMRGSWIGAKSQGGGMREREKFGISKNKVVSIPHLAWCFLIIQGVV